MKYIGVVVSDIHSNDWKQFNQDGRRLKQTTSIMDEVIRWAFKYDCPILFPGDLNHDPNSMSNSVMNQWAHVNKELKDKNVILYGINGNHDFKEINSFKNPKNGYVHHLMRLGANVRCIDFSGHSLHNYKVHGIPYINGNSDFIEALEERTKELDANHNILLIHRDLPGAIEPNGKRIGEDNHDLKLRKLLKKFDLVLAGHIHRPQQLKRVGKNVYMCGSPMQQRRSDSGCEMGFWLIREDFTMKFKPLKEPQFKFYKEGEHPGNETDFWIKLPKEIKADKDVGKVFSASKDRGELVKQYLKVKGEKNKSRFKLLMDLIND